MFFLFVLFIFVTLTAQRLDLGSYVDSFLGAMALWLNCSKCVTVIDFRGLAPPDEVFAGLDCGCVLVMDVCRSFLQFVV
jgi:hypothetical protein